jgi:SAM-dependent methyltransferase
MDPNEYHKFLWANHMAYAHTYEVKRRFGEGNLHESRIMFLAELQRVMAVMKADPADVESVLDIGCSLGYLLRHVEKTLFTQAHRVTGVDIDVYAVREGQRYLSNVGSSVRLLSGDMEKLADIIAHERYDVVICTGALMYLDEAKATRMVSVILEHTNLIACFAGLASPGVDNATLDASTVRDEDLTFIHNIDAMVSKAKGRVIDRCWEGMRTVDGNTIYFVFARPQGSHLPRSDDDRQPLPV